jgi:hypothetical protein
MVVYSSQDRRAPKFTLQLFLILTQGILTNPLGEYMVIKKKRMKLKKDKPVSKVRGPQGPVSRGAYDAKSPDNKGMSSYVLGTKTNKNPNIRGLTPKGKGSKKKR